MTYEEKHKENDRIIDSMLSYLNDCDESAREKSRITLAMWKIMKENAEIEQMTAFEREQVIRYESIEIESKMNKIKIK